MGKFLHITVIAALCVALSHQQKPLVTFDEFSNAIKSTGYGNPTQDQYKGFIQSLLHGLINTKQEAAMALARILLKSGGFLRNVAWDTAFSVGEV